MVWKAFAAALLSTLTVAAFAQSAGPAASDDAMSGASKPAASAQALETMSESIVVNGTVRGLDKQNRLLTLEVPGGDVAVIHVGNNVVQFGDLKVGDAAVVRYTQAAVLAIGKSDAIPPSSAHGANAPGAPASTTVIRS
jgi:hypothetical protein